MTRFGLTFHHYGLALRTKERAALFLEGIGYAVGELVHDTVQDVWVTLCHGQNLPTVELVLPAGPGGPLDIYLKKQESVFYHTCYLAPDVAGSLDAIAKAGIGVVTVRPPKPAILFSNIPVSFHYAEGFGLIEFIHAASV
jgi:methylmalonyl-CoA/ethylmalonyl-CoA epimerase